MRNEERRLNMKINRILLVVLVLACNLIHGCSGASEINNKGFVNGVIIENRKSGEGYKVILEVSNPQKAGNNDIYTEIIMSEEKSLFGCIRDVIKAYGKKLYWAHTKVVIINKQIMEEQYTEVLDMFIRDTEMRENMWILVGEDIKNNLFSVKDKHNISSSDTLHQIMKNLHYNPEAVVVDIFDFYKDYVTEGIDPCTGILGMKFMEDQFYPELLGTAIFKENRMVGKLGYEESKALTIMKNKKMRGLFIIEGKTEGIKNTHTLEVRKNNCSIKPKLNKETGQIIFMINIELDAVMGEGSTTEEYIDGELLKKIKQEGERNLTEDINRLMRKLSKEFKSDPIGFGRLYNVSYPNEWKKIKSGWREEYSKAKFQVDVNITIKGSGLLR